MRWGKVMKAFYETVKMELKLFTRYFANMFFIFIFPTLMLLIFGGIYGNKPVPMFGGYGTIDISIPSYTALIIAVTGIMAFPLSICGYREKKVLKRFKGTPISQSMVIFSQAVVSIIMTIIGFIILILVGKIVYDIKVIGNISYIISTFLLSMFSIFSIGFLVGSVAPNMKAGNAIANLIYFLMIFLGGATIPLEVFPDFMIKIAKALPLYYAVDLLKNAWLNKSLESSIRSITVLFTLMIVCIIISVKNFRWE